MIQNSTLKIVGIIAALGVCIIGAGELLMHWTGDLGGNPGDGPYQFFMEISPKRLVTGHFLTVLMAPMYFLGYWQVSERLRPVSGLTRKVFFGLSLYVLTMAAIWIGSRAFLGRTLQIVDDPALQAAISEEYTLLLETLIWILRFGMMGISIIFAVLVLRRKTSYPAWMGILNPFVLLVLVFSTIKIPSIGPHIVPAALNVAHVPFFLLSALAPYVVRGDDQSS